MAKQTRTRQQRQTQRGSSQQQEKAKLMSDLSSALSDDALMTLIDEAQQSGDEMGVLRAAHRQQFGDTSSNGEHDEQSLENAGMTVIEKTRLAFDHNTRQPASIPVGWIIERKLVDGAKLYAGTTMTWTIYGQARAFETEGEAKAAATYYLKSIADRDKKSHNLGVVKATSTVHYAAQASIDSQLAKMINLRVEGERANKVQRLYLGLRAENCEVDKRPVASVADAIRYLIDKIEVPEAKAD